MFHRRADDLQSACAGRKLFFLSFQVLAPCHLTHSPAARPACLPACPSSGDLQVPRHHRFFCLSNIDEHLAYLIVARAVFVLTTKVPVSLVHAPYPASIHPRVASLCCLLLQRTRSTRALKHLCGNGTELRAESTVPRDSLHLRSTRVSEILPCSPQRCPVTAAAAVIKTSLLLPVHYYRALPPLRNPTTQTRKRSSKAIGRASQPVRTNEPASPPCLAYHTHYYYYYRTYLTVHSLDVPRSSHRPPSSSSPQPLRFLRHDFCSMFTSLRLFDTTCDYCST